MILLTKPNFSKTDIAYRQSLGYKVSIPRLFALLNCCCICYNRKHWWVLAAQDFLVAQGRTLSRDCRRMSCGDVLRAQVYQPQVSSHTLVLGVLLANIGYTVIIPFARSRSARFVWKYRPGWQHRMALDATPPIRLEMTCWHRGDT